jgi:predicted phosphoribosyltransferase
MSTQMTYKDRQHAGRVLAEFLDQRNILNPVILALPRGGVPVADLIAQKLRVPLDVLIVRKIGAPFNPEYGIGAISEDLDPLFNAGELLPYEDLEEEVKEIVDAEKQELSRRIQMYRGERNLPEIKNQTIILVDDGLATGVSAAAAGRFLKKRGAQKIYLAVPVAPHHPSKLLMDNIDEVICPYRPMNISAIGLCYEEFNQVSDVEVMTILSHYHPETKRELSF